MGTTSAVSPSITAQACAPQPPLLARTATAYPISLTNCA
jgi:hypothetical protein